MSKIRSTCLYYKQYIFDTKHFYMPFHLCIYANEKQNSKEEKGEKLDLNRQHCVGELVKKRNGGREGALFFQMKKALLFRCSRSILLNGKMKSQEPNTSGSYAEYFRFTNAIYDNKVKADDSVND